MSIITLTTDLGHNDFYVAKLKSSVLKHLPSSQFLDINHNIRSHDIQFAAYCLMNVWKDLPKGSIHIVSVYNHYATTNEYIVFERDGHFFIGPNNGVFTLIFQDLSEAETHSINGGFDTFFETYAHAAALVGTGAPISDIGPKVASLKQKINIIPVYTQTEIRATIIHVDIFGNVILNIEKSFFKEIQKNRSFEIYFKYSDPITAIHESYSQVPIGEVVALFNMNNFLELGINMGNASELLGLFENGTIQIHFKN